MPVDPLEVRRKRENLMVEREDGPVRVPPLGAGFIAVNDVQDVALEDGGWSAPTVGQPAQYRAATAKEAAAAIEASARREAARQTWRSDSTGKGRHDLIYPNAVHRLAKRLEEGAATHGDRAWEQNNTPEGRARCLESLLRHVWQVADGLEDEDHLAAVLANAMMLMKFQEQQARVDRLSDGGPRIGG